MMNEEYEDPNTFMDVTYAEYKNKLENLRLDTIQANDPEVKAYAEKRYLEVREKYVQLLDKDLRLQKLYAEQAQVEGDMQSKINEVQQ